MKPNASEKLYVDAQDKSHFYYEQFINYMKGT